MSITQNEQFIKFLSEEDDLNKIRDQIKTSKFDLNYRSPDGTPLEIALKKKNKELVQILVESGADVDLKEENSLSPIEKALESEPKLLPILFSKSKQQKQILERLNTSGPEKPSPLITAIVKDDTETLNALLSIPGVDLNSYHPDFTPLMLAVHRSKPETIRILSEHPKVDINKMNAGGTLSPLRLAISKGKLETLKILVENPALDINKEYANGKTALMEAASKDNPTKVDQEILKVLVGVPGINIHQKSSSHFLFRQTAYQMATAPELYEILSVSQKKIIEKFMAYLKIKSKNKGRVYSDEDIERIVKQIDAGMCSGLAGNWAIRKKEEQDSIFSGNIRLILNWDETIESLEAGNGFLDDVFEQTLNDALWIQEESVELLNPTIRTQRDLAGIYEVTKPKYAKRLQEEFSFTFILKRSEMLELFQDIFNEGKIIFMGGFDHAIAAIKKDGVFYIYDSEDPKGEQKFTDLADAQQYIEFSLYSGLGHSTENMPLNLAVFDFKGNKPAHTKTKEEFITSFIQRNKDPERVTEIGEDTYDNLVWAADRGDLVTVQQLTKFDDDFDYLFAFSVASRYEFTDILDVLLEHHEYTDVFLWDALREAAENEKHNSVQFISKCLGQEDVFIRAARKGYSVLIGSLLKKENIDPEILKKGMLVAASHGNDEISKSIEAALTLFEQQKTKSAVLFSPQSQKRPTLSNEIKEISEISKTDEKPRPK